MVPAKPRASSAAHTPSDAAEAWANLQRADESGHGWLMSLTRSRPPRQASSGETTPRGFASEPGASELEHAHATLAGEVVTQWQALAPERAGELAALTIALVNTGFSQLDAGVPLVTVEDVVLGSIEAMIQRFGA